MLKKFAVLLLLLSHGVATSASAAEEVLYCADDGVAGFEPREDYKRYQYEPTRFTLRIDFELNYILSDKLFFKLHNKTACLKDFIQSPILYCLNGVGTTFAIHRETLKYHRSVVFLSEPAMDSITVAYGTCEKF